MKYISLIICTYNRTNSLERLINSVHNQSRKFDEIIVVDGSDLDCQHENLKLIGRFPEIFYHHVGFKQRGLTNQRNFGLNQINQHCTHVTFLDDDLVLDEEFCRNIDISFDIDLSAIGISGVDLVENRYTPHDPSMVYGSGRFFLFNQWVTVEPFRYRLRNWLEIS